MKKLGVNCVEFLPLQKFAPAEPPYGKKPKRASTIPGIFIRPTTGVT
jgi:hypothetical protein